MSKNIMSPTQYSRPSANAVYPDVLGVAIMLSITIFATIVGDMLPVSNNTPLIG
jgi:hypothetical protein